MPGVGDIAGGGGGGVGEGGGSETEVQWWAGKAREEEYGRVVNAGGGGGGEGGAWERGRVFIFLFIFRSELVMESNVAVNRTGSPKHGQTLPYADAHFIMFSYYSVNPFFVKSNL